MNKNTLLKVSLTLAAVVPMFAYAATIGTIMTDVQTILNVLIPMLMILATVVFLWGVITYITAGGDEEKQSAGKSYIIWGLIGLFAMVAVWGLVRALVNSFGVGSQGVPAGPGSF